MCQFFILETDIMNNILTIIKYNVLIHSEKEKFDRCNAGARGGLTYGTKLS